MATIIVTAGSSQGVKGRLSATVSTIGRDAACTVVVADERVSNKHLQIWFDEPFNAFRVKDLRSTNGTLLNDQKLTLDSLLREGDELAIGNSRLRFTVHDEPTDV
jgi:pSer/pThr/pTyr-binding forkhead associated (FHA) protein